MFLQIITACHKILAWCTCVNQTFQSFGKENIDEFTKANLANFSQSKIWLGKILLVNDARFAKFTPNRISHYSVYLLYACMCTVVCNTYVFIPCSFCFILSMSLLSFPSSLLFFSSSLLTFIVYSSFFLP